MSLQRDPLTGRRAGAGEQTKIRGQHIAMNSPEQTAADGHRFEPGPPDWTHHDFAHNWHKVGFYCGTCRHMHYNHEGCNANMTDIYMNNIETNGQYKPVYVRESMLYTQPSQFTGVFFYPTSTPDHNLIPMHPDEAELIRSGFMLDHPYGGLIGPPLLFGDINDRLPIAKLLTKRPF